MLHRHTPLHAERVHRVALGTAATIIPLVCAGGCSASEHPASVASVAPVTLARWDSACAARFRAVHAQIATFGPVTTELVTAPTVGVEVQRGHDARALYASVYEDRTTDATREDATGPELADPNWHPNPRIWDAWHERAEDVATPYSAMVPQVYSALEIAFHHRRGGRALTGAIGAVPEARSVAEPFAALMRPVLEACVHDIDPP